MGKTVFLYYLTWRLRKIESVTSVIKERVRRDFVDLAEEEVLRKSDLPLNHSLQQWILFDSRKNGPPIGMWPSVLVTLPKYEILSKERYKISYLLHHSPTIWRQFDKQTMAKRLTMPVWTYAELCACRASCFPQVSEEFLEQAYARWCV